uniref:Error-prone, lesion bypass DNA polymerase V (UmuC) n=1 Tax=Klebsiella pneumoniae TaxID=573 RepID=A0A8B0ST66_KLEPN|nr:Error-prone, lesion bypass DNA polymerase V (UmuC) [Klebsiella pneumoniae]
MTNVSRMPGELATVWIWRIFGRQLRGHVLSGTGLTIGVGFGATKKHWPNRRSGRQRNGHNSGGYWRCRPKNPRRTAKLLSLQPVEEIWGVGEPDSEKKLHVMGDHHRPAAVADEPHIYPEKNFNVVLERTVRELNGESCISLEEAPPPKQQIVCSRSFGQRITTYEEMRRAVCQYAERAAEKVAR